MHRDVQDVTLLVECDDAKLCGGARQRGPGGGDVPRAIQISELLKKK